MLVKAKYWAQASGMYHQKEGATQVWQSGNLPGFLELDTINSAFNICQTLCSVVDLVLKSKSHRERHVLYDVTYIENLKFDKNELFTKQKQSHRHR